MLTLSWSKVNGQGREGSGFWVPYFQTLDPGTRFIDLLLLILWALDFGPWSGPEHVPGPLTSRYLRHILPLQFLVYGDEGDSTCPHPGSQRSGGGESPETGGTGKITPEPLPRSRKAEGKPGAPVTAPEGSGRIDTVTGQPGWYRGRSVPGGAVFFVVKSEW